jgi:hypothetical protein
MATEVVEVLKVEVDGNTIECKPLKIKWLREFMAAVTKLEDVADDNIKSLDVMVECCLIAFKQYAPDKYTADDLEEKLDMNDIYAIIEGASGIKLDPTKIDSDPN